MKVFSRLYVGLQAPRDGVPLGFATPYEENAAGRKRQETVNNWASPFIAKDGKYVREEPITKIIENDPAPGFKITDDVKRVYWGGGNVVWRVEDPRGFELEIQSNNLMAIIQSAGVNEGGLIPGQCVWGRSGGDNILLHETSDEYKDAVKAAETLKAPKQVGKASRRVGGLYRCVDGSIGIFMGKLHVTRLQYPSVPDDYRDNNVRPWIQIGDRKIVVSETQFEINPSVEFEGVLEAEQGDGESAKPGVNLKLYKKAPLVDDLGSVDVEVSDRFLLTLNWSFASSAITATRILSVTVNPILNPVPALVPWSRKMFNERLSDIKQYVKNNCGNRGYLLPLSSLLTSYRHDKVLQINGKLYSSIDVIGEPYGRRSSAHTKQTEESYHVALETTMAAGSILWRSGTDDARSALIPEQWRGYYSSRYKFLPEGQVQFIKLPTFDLAEELYAYITSLYNEGSLLYVTCKEAHA
jgi:hypothetical protein